MVIYVAAWVAVRGDKIAGFQDGLVPFLIILFGVGGLIAAERSFSVTIIVLAIGMTIFFVGGGNLSQLAILLTIGTAALITAMIASDYPLKRAGEWYAVHFNPAAISPDTLRFLSLLRTGGGIGTDPVSGCRRPGYRCYGATICSPISARTWVCPVCCWWWCCMLPWPTEA